MTTPEQGPVVLDASAVVELLMRSPEGQWLRQQIDWTRGVHAPDLLLIETAGVLRKLELQGVVSRERSDQAFQRLVDMQVRLYDASGLLPEAWAMRHHITLRDGCYVVLAQHLGATLVTGDGRLARAHQLGVRTLVPPTRSS